MSSDVLADDSVYLCKQDVEPFFHGTYTENGVAQVKAVASLDRASHGWAEVGSQYSKQHSATQNWPGLPVLHSDLIFTCNFY